ncbi:MAG: hypothetical protein BWY63_01995 [Chloroflexi bacterium ADurb.Bin360]|nr:MAG: hypothetical protein BWY63_01995 [Chloroflexi bacterium ADurb.Bin360]
MPVELTEGLCGDAEVATQSLFLLPGAIQEQNMCPPEVGVSRVWLEYLRETLGIGVPCPRLSWQVETSLTNWQ